MTGSPVISLKWLKDGREISSSPKHTMALTDSVASLDMVNCSLEDSGEYVCEASSEAGSDCCSSTVTVKGWCGRTLRSSYRSSYPVETPRPLTDTEGVWPVHRANAVSMSYGSSSRSEEVLPSPANLLLL